MSCCEEGERLVKLSRLLTLFLKSEVCKLCKLVIILFVFLFFFFKINFCFRKKNLEVESRRIRIFSQRVSDSEIQNHKWS